LIASAFSRNCVRDRGQGDFAIVPAEYHQLRRGIENAVRPGPEDRARGARRA
jgi:hypothetical protein